jgi:integrase
VAFVRKRPSDEARGKAGKWTCYYVGVDLRRKSRAGFTDRASSERLANRLEEEARQIREGMLDPRERTRREAGLRSVADHAEDYRLALLAKGGTATHAKRTKSEIVRLLEDAAVASVADLPSDRIQATLGRWKAKGRSARTCNSALAAVKAFARWLWHAHRIADLPRGVMALAAYSEDADRRVVRRALSRAELARLLAAAESGPAITLRTPGFPRHPIAGAERALLYRLAMGTGFRANELRSLVPACFHLDGDEPYIALSPHAEKNRKGTDQPIPRRLAAEIRDAVAAAEPGRPVVPVPEKTAKMLRVDLEAAGIAYRTEEGIVDFHSIRSSYVTHLIESGASIKDVQTLARHSTPTLTIGIYAKTSKGKLRKALEGE